jgi:opacity protein-like surface antigen
VKRIRCGILLTMLAVAWTAAPAQAQLVVTPYLGVNLSGDVEAAKGGIGGSVAYFGSGLGFELDLQRYHHFFKDADVAGLVPRFSGIDLNTDAWSFMGNVVVPIRIQSATNWRPYGIAGLGVIRAMFDASVAGTFVEESQPGLPAPSPSATDLFDTAQNNLGFNVGGGVMYSLKSRVGFRGDLRYFRALVDEDKREGGFFKDYDFWRATFGVTLGFPR